MKSSKKRIFVTVVVAIIAIVMAVPTLAASGNPFKDVTKKSVGKEGVKAISFIQCHHGYDGIVGTGAEFIRLKNGLYKKVSRKFKPYKKVTRMEFLTILENLYGKENVPVTMTDIRKANKVVTGAYVQDRLCRLAKQLGVRIKYPSEGEKTKLRRVDVAGYILNFIKVDKAFMPRR